MKPTLLTVPCWLGYIQLFVSQHKAHMREIGELFPIDVAQVYRAYIISELALNAAMCMKRI